MEKFAPFIKRRAFNKAGGPGKKIQGPTFIPDYRVVNFPLNFLIYFLCFFRRG